MDAAVLAAIAKWPDVPAVYGWLSLTARGQWRLRGEPIANRAIVDYISRNYAAEVGGCWYFQNGPQRVYVALEAAPWVWRAAGPASAYGLVSHTGVPVHELRGAWLDEGGRVFLATELGFGLLASTDTAVVQAALQGAQGSLDRALDALARGDNSGVTLRGAVLGLDRSVPFAPLRWDDAPQRFNFDPDPQAD
jgi:hypothetical protein